MPARGDWVGRRYGRRRDGGRSGGGADAGVGKRQFHKGRPDSAPNDSQRQDPSAMDVNDSSVPSSLPTSTEAQGGLPDSNSSTARFADLAADNLVHPLLLRAITNDLKFDRMTPVQAATLRELLPPKRSDCLVQAKTGTGKTLAFLLPALQTMLKKAPPRSSEAQRDDRPISLLVISPTRELALQIAVEAKSLLQHMATYRVRVVMGGANKFRETEFFTNGCDVLIATPGRLLDHLGDGHAIHALRALDTLVLDEADRLLDMGFMRDLRNIVSKLPDRKQVPRQGMLFSATIADHVKQVSGLVLGPDYRFISTIPKGEVSTHKRVPQHLITVPTFSSVPAAMVGVVRQEIQAEAAKGNKDFKAIMFAPTAAAATLYADVLSKIGGGLPPVVALHSRLTQNRRTTITDEFRAAKRSILVATDIVARGMDFPGVTTVFQIGLPLEKQSYIHRLGRTARADAEGKGIFLIAEAEAFFPQHTLKEISFIPRPADLSAAAEVNPIVTNLGENKHARVYQAWLGYYKQYLKELKWTPEELVRQANLYARDGLGAPETPGIQKSSAGKMGLRGVKGLIFAPPMQKPPRGGKSAAAPKGEPLANS